MTLYKEDEFQSTHPHGVRRLHTWQASLYPLVSIHAPARGATSPRGLRSVRPSVSIHAPARGATSYKPAQAAGGKLFQSTHPHGVRQRLPFMEQDEIRVSIHAPARGATSPLVCPFDTDCRFNPRTRTGCDFTIFFHYFLRRSFNPRTRTGCDGRLFLRPFHPLNSFNPRTRTGCDDIIAFSTTLSMRFNPRTRTGCDDTSSPGVPGGNCFNPRTRTGCDHILAESLQRVLQVSIHAPARGATAVSKPRSARHTGFNPRTRTGCDPAERWLVQVQRGVSIHAPARGATREKGQAFIEGPMFQSTHPHGVRLRYLIPRCTRRKLFQSTHPHGVRPDTYGLRVCSFSSFNPRTRTGCDV
ncbi:Uncharacterized [Syntrophomonas zehnderi OL-4]|uniref:Uncharacterized n=1 Tax=Syntrophomonas zehnderi OL-4 TaxID=690567 RepID=A0A0E4GE47_9FIRM|nr:Uncharacterized [Syntrophomonas zehnderi OL-4]